MYEVVRYIHMTVGISIIPLNSGTLKFLTSHLTASLVSEGVEILH